VQRRDFVELGVVRVATPCDANWDDMPGDGGRRYCDKCRLHVYDFSKFTSNEARELLVKTEGRLCGRIYVRTDGTVLTKDCPRGLAAARRRLIGAWTAAVGFMVYAVGSVVKLVNGEVPAPQNVQQSASGSVRPVVIRMAEPAARPHVTMGEMKYTPLETMQEKH
jgi:hypothetical protein